MNLSAKKAAAAATEGDEIETQHEMIAKLQLILRGFYKFRENNKKCQEFEIDFLQPAEGFDISDLCIE